MKSKVFFTAVNNSDDMQAIRGKFARLLSESKMLDFIGKGDRVSVKIHFGEEENTGYVRPEYVKVLCERIVDKNADVFLSDTNTLYSGRRMGSDDHKKLAYEHGFIQNIAGAKVIIPDDSKKGNVSRIKINQKYVKEAKISSVFLNADIIISVAHFKGHMMTGFGGALKNIGMGCASREGKLEQHSDLSPFVIENKCTGCMACEEVCPIGAIMMRNERAYIDSTKCTGCAGCIAVCPEEAIDVHWESGADIIQEKMIEYAKAVLDEKRGSVLFINFLIKITKECDCLAKDDPRIAPDIGILISSDPVSIDKASLDLVVKACGKDIFKEVHPLRDGYKQLQYAHKLGLGSLEYELGEI